MDVRRPPIEIPKALRDMGFIPAYDYYDQYSESSSAFPGAFLRLRSECPRDRRERLFVIPGGKHEDSKS